MSEIDRRTALKVTAAGIGSLVWPLEASVAADTAAPFGNEFPNLESLTTGEWWLHGTPAAATSNAAKPAGKGGNQWAAPSMDVPRDQVVAFAIYTQHGGVLKLSAQLFPLRPGEERVVRLELHHEGEWREVAKGDVLYPGWDAHFRLEDWDASRDVRYRVRHGEQAHFEGLIRRDPVEKDEIVVANMSCNSSRTIGERPELVANLKFQNPDLLFFGGDQTYRHTEHTAG